MMKGVLCVLLCSVVLSSALPLSPTTLLESNVHFSCDACSAMVKGLSLHCRANGGESYYSGKQFIDSCRSRALSFSEFNQTTAEPACSEFFRLVSDIYCPLDPCTHITAQEAISPRAVCDLMRCTEEGAKEARNTPVAPLMCPEYVQAVVKECTKQRAVHPDRPSDPRKACNPYAPRFEQEGCDHVVDLMAQSVAPTDLCKSLECDEFAKLSLAQYCERVLHLPYNRPVPVPEYVELFRPGNVTKQSNQLADSAVGLRIESATYGVNCYNQTNNILQSLRADCQGKLRCTFGNRNLPSMSSEQQWLLEEDLSPSCSPGFVIHYRCTGAGELKTINADGAARFQAIPFGCS